MAERRMFAKTIIDSDMFLDMPVTAQLLYFHLSMRADDDGFINKPKTIMRMCSAKEDDMSILIAKQFVIPFESGIVVIKHWKIHNYIQKDRYKPSSFEEKNKVVCGEGMIYRLVDDLDTKCIQTVSNMDTDGIQSVDEMDTQVRLGKDRLELGKDNTLLSVGTDTGEQINYKKVANLFNEICKSLPKVKNLSENRKRNIKNANEKLNGDFESFFKKVESSDFLTGRKGNWSGACFDWVMKPQNLIKIMEGNYDNKKQQDRTNTGTGYYIDYSEGIDE